MIFLRPHLAGVFTGQALRSVLAVVLAAPLTSLLAGCGRHSEAAPAPGAGAAPPAIKVVRPVRQSCRHVIEQPGQIEAFEQTPVYAMITGYVAEVCVDMDTRVQKGDCLAKLWVPQMEDDLRQKKALVIQAQAQLEQEERALDAATANLEAAKAQVAEAQSNRKRVQADYERWQSEYKRVDKMVKARVIDEQTLAETLNQFKAADAIREEIEAKIRSAEAAQVESEARRNKTRADIEAARARLQVARVNVEQMQTMLAYAVLRAPYPGVVIRRNVHTGHLLKPGTSTKMDPLFVVMRMDKVRIFVDVPEQESHLVHPGIPAQVRIQALQDQEIEATVTRTSWALDPHNRTLRAEIELPNPNGDLRPGMYAYASISVENPKAWTLPVAAVHMGDDQAYCYCVENGKAVRTPVRVGLRQGSNLEVLKKRCPTGRVAGESRWQDFSGEERIVLSTGTVKDGQAVGVSSQ